MSTVAAARQPHELERRDHRHVALGARADPDDGAREHRPLDEDRHAGRRRERRRRRPGRSPSRRRPRRAARRASPPRRPPRRPSPGRPAGRPARARAPGGASHTKTSDLTIWSRSHPIASAAAWAVEASRRELLEPRLGARRAEEDGDTLDGLGPGHRPIVGATLADALSRRTGSGASGHARPVGGVVVVGRRRAAAPRRGSSRPRGAASTTGEDERRNAREERVADEERRARPCRSGCRTIANGPRVTSPAATGFGNGVSERPERRGSPRLRTPHRRSRARRRRPRAP